MRKEGRTLLQLAEGEGRQEDRGRQGFDHGSPSSWASGIMVLASTVRIAPAAKAYIVSVTASGAPARKW